MNRFEGKVVLVTGASSGIGEATAVRLGAEGARLLLTGRDDARLAATSRACEEVGAVCRSELRDLVLPESAGAIVGSALNAWGQIDVVVNCAGSFGWNAPTDSLSDDEWYSVLDVNLTAPMRVIRAAIPALRASSGVIVNVSSISGYLGDRVSVCAHYAAAKAGLDGLTRQLSVELAPNVRVVGVAPGTIETPMLDGWLDDPEQRQAWLERFVPARRIGAASEVAAAIAFAASNDGSYVTGTTLMVDGGMAVV